VNHILTTFEFSLNILNNLSTFLTFSQHIGKSMKMDIKEENWTEIDEGGQKEINVNIKGLILYHTTYRSEIT